MYEFRKVKGYIEVYFNDKFICTADNMEEAQRDAEAHQRGEL